MNHKPLSLRQFHVGRWLGPAVDVGSALTYKILKSNRQVVPRSTVLHLTQQKLDNPDHIASRIAFNEGIVQKIGEPAPESDFNPD
mgnify:CR=1 FL=1